MLCSFASTSQSKVSQYNTSIGLFSNRPHIWRADKWLEEMSQESFAVTRDNPSAY